MKEMHQILKFTNLESSTFEKVFCVRPTDFSLFGVIFTLLNFFQFQANLEIYSGKPDTSFKGTVMQIEKAMINDRLDASKLS